MNTLRPNWPRASRPSKSDMRHVQQLFLSILASLSMGLDSAQAMDKLIIDQPETALDHRNDYPEKLLRAILDKTTRLFGPYSLVRAEHAMERKRLRVELQRGVLVNVSVKATQPAWEESLTTIRIPVDKGIDGYRIFHINRADQGQFSKITRLEQLKALPLGVDQAWSSYPIYQDQGFNVVAGNNYEGLFAMLEARRFDYFPHGVSEVYLELERRQTRFPEMAIERDLMLYYPFPKYIFVSPKEPRIAQRLETGFRQMLADGSFDRQFLAHYQPFLDRVNFCQRRLFRVPNPFLHPQTPLGEAGYWLDPFKPSRIAGKTVTFCAKTATAKDTK